MTADRFGELLKRPYLLSGQNATELEELIAAYPWCGPLRRLRYQKAVLDSEPAQIELWRSRAEPFLNRASTLSDETALIAANPTKADLHFNFAPHQDQAQSTLSDGGNSETGSFDAGIISEASQATLSPTAADPNQLLSSIIELAACGADTAEWYLLRNGLIMEYARPKPAPIESLPSFKSWKQRRAKTSWHDLLMLGIEQHKDQPKRKSKSTEVTPEPEVASETLADLLAAQGHADKAIRMYEQLSLRYPAKMATFAARIQALQQLPA